MITKNLFLLAACFLVSTVSAESVVRDFKIECDWIGGNPYEKGGRATFEYRSSKGESKFLVDHGFFEYPAEGVVSYEVDDSHMDGNKMLNVYYSKTFPTLSGFGEEIRMFRLIYRLDDRNITVRGATLNKSKSRLVTAQEHGARVRPSETTTQYRNCMSMGL